MHFETVHGRDMTRNTFGRILSYCTGVMDAVNRGSDAHFVIEVIPSCASCEAPPRSTELKEAPYLKIIPKKPFPCPLMHKGVMSDLRQLGSINKENLTDHPPAWIHRVGSGFNGGTYLCPVFIFSFLQCIVSN